MIACPRCHKEALVDTKKINDYKEANASIILPVVGTAMSGRSTQSMKLVQCLHCKYICLHLNRSAEFLFDLGEEQIPYTQG